jgi:hypothetical protein
MIGFKQQAHRWTKGSMQTCLKLLPRILRSRLPLAVKTEAFFHLTNTIVYLLTVILTILMYPCFLSFYSPFNHFSGTWSQYLFTTSLFVLATCSASTFFVFGQKELFGSEGGWKTVYYMPILMALGVGVSLNNCKAVLEALWGGIRRRQSSEFVRTQKYGVTGQHGKVWGARSLCTLKRLALPIVEIAFGCYMSCWILISLYYQFCMTAIPFLGVFAGGFFYVGFSSLYTLYTMQRERQSVLLAVPAEPVST